jgi:site-specific recombinase XerD
MHSKAAQAKCPSLSVSPHVLRHSTAMNLLRNGVDRSVIALWLGHESIDTTRIYPHFNMELKEKALAETKSYASRSRRYRLTDQLLSFLQSL